MTDYAISVDEFNSKIAAVQAASSAGTAQSAETGAAESLAGVQEILQGDKSYTTEISQLSRAESTGFINVKYPPAPCVAARGDGVTDDTAAIQAAINCLLSGNYSILFFPRGTYLISAPLNCYSNGRYVAIKGGSRHSSHIVATAEMDYMIKLWSDDAIFQVNLQDIRFDLGIYATIGIDAHKSGYGIFDDIAIFTSKKDSICIKLSGWCNRITNSIIYGDSDYDGNSFGIVPAIGILIDVNQSTNNLIIESNVFGLIGSAIKSNDYINDIHIQKNTFDIVGKILLSQHGLKNCSFKYNYCESCGGSNATIYDLEPCTYTKSTYTRTLHSPIILHEDTSMSTQYLTSIEIDNNQFANCHGQKLIAISGVKDFSFANNDFYSLSNNSPRYTYENVIYVFGIGIRNESKFYAENKYPSKISTLVTYDNNYDAYYTNNGTVLINTKNQDSSTLFTSKPRIKPKLSDADITDTQTITVNATTTLRIDYNLSAFDSKHPHKVILNVTKVTGTKIIYNAYEKIGNIRLVNSGNIITGTNVSGQIILSNERPDRNYSSFYLEILADGDITIDSVFLLVANNNKSIIQLI